ncbi:sigma-70 family RNA polymerase sigma factor [Variovorax sp. LT1P1]|uniref:sigma-70 family RNA polymerase sigma factor n=1 Tax=Variovorax sp. LT1P1 TaxID=3443730 RepID=UPI003F44934A
MLDERYLSQFPVLRQRLVRAAARMLAGHADAEDVVQDAYLRALEAGDTLRPDSAQAWLTTVMQHLAIDRLRRDNWMQRWLRDADASAANAPSAEAEAAQAESIDRALRSMAARLSPAEGAAVLLREVFEASFKEMAQASGRTEAACRQQLHRALLRLRQDRDSEDAASEAHFRMYRQALRDGDPRTLFAMLRQPPVRAVAAAAVIAPHSGTSRAVCQVMQMGGRLGLVLTLGGKVLCVLPLDVRPTQEEQPLALSSH